jgi:nitroimidazol reductase NimA-like FMN-containing flavoprotein (pyridoxamine 5'-phosphate oxidase superfamily)
MEVDEIESLFHWESVVLRGRLEVLDDGPHSAAVERHAKALEALRQLIPETLTEHDPTPDRTVLCAIYLDEVEGRRARPGTGT